MSRFCLGNTTLKIEIHNLALDLKSGVITWEEFDKKLDVMLEKQCK